MKRTARECVYVDKGGKVCGRTFTTSLSSEVLCRRCRRRVPKCGSCTIVMGCRYGYMEDFGRKVGRYKVCTACSYEIKKKKYLAISEEKRLLVSGSLVIRARARSHPTTVS